MRHLRQCRQRGAGHSGFPERLGIVCWLDRWSLSLPLAHSERVIHARLVGKSIHTNRDLDLRIDSGCSRVLVHDIKALSLDNPRQQSNEPPLVAKDRAQASLEPPSARAACMRTRTLPIVLRP